MDTSRFGARPTIKELDLFTHVFHVDYFRSNTIFPFT